MAAAATCPVPNPLSDSQSLSWDWASSPFHYQVPGCHIQPQTLRHRSRNRRQILAANSRHNCACWAMEFYAVVGWLVYVFILSARVYRLFYNFIYETFYWQRRVVDVAVRLPPLLGTHSAKRNENATALHASTPPVGWMEVHVPGRGWLRPGGATRTEAAGRAWIPISIRPDWDFVFWPTNQTQELSCLQISWPLLEHNRVGWTE